MTQVATRDGGRNIVVFDPSQEFEDIYDRMGRLMGFALGEPGTPAQVAGRPWIPAADVSETDDAYVIELELPGVRKDDVDIQMNDNELVVTGELTQTERGRLRRRTRRLGRFEYRVVLPGDVNAEMVNANLSDGVLTMTVPKAAAAKPRHVEIKG
jgi:HSP20 family protein